MKKEYFLVDNNNNQAYIHFCDLNKKKTLNNLKNNVLAKNGCVLTVRWYNFKMKKKYKGRLTVRLALKRALMMILILIKKYNLSKKSLNASGLASIVIQNKKIIIEPQFS